MSISDTPHSPLDIEVLIHYHTSPAPHPNADAPAVNESINRYIDDDIFCVVRVGSYQLTTKGLAWLHEILSVPYPRQAWIGESGKEIKL